MKSGDQILKTDVLGRVHTPKERREALLDEFEKSGASAMAFAKLVGIKYQTFAAWAHRRKQEPTGSKTSARPVPSVRWLEAVVEQKKSPAGCGQSVLVVQLPGGARMEIGDATQATLAAVVLRSLESKPALSC